MTPRSDAQFMALALALGRRGQGRTAGNPAVGCVIVQDGRIVGRGWTQPSGRPHAEAVALAQAAQRARGAVVYVTLEPCAHYGRTPPCADALIAAGIARLVCAIEDPDPRVCGAGFAKLRAAGIKVEIGPGAAQARRDLTGFLGRLTQGYPAVTLKLASSLDGRIATGTGQSKWITSRQSRAYVHMLRARHEAVMVGAGTVRADDPLLSVRGLAAPTDGHQPARVVLSRRLNLPLDAQLARHTGLILCHDGRADAQTCAAWRAAGAHLITSELDHNHLDIKDVMRKLAQYGLSHIFCEGGSALAASLIEADLVERLIVFSAGIAIGAEGLPAIGALGLEQLDLAARYECTQLRQIGPDVMSTWHRADKSA